jgi:hypothetical protein
MARDYTKFVILGDARTGSNMLAQALNTHPDIVCFREVFHFMHDYVDFNVDGYDRDDPADFAMRAADPVRFLNERIFGEHTGKKAVGFKYLYGHFWGFTGLIEHLAASREIHFIHLKRANMLRSLVSLRLAERSGRWIEDWGVAAKPMPFMPRALSAAAHPLRTVSRLRKKRREQQEIRSQKSGLRLSARECVEFFERTAREVARADELAEGHETLTVFYEKFLDDKAAVFRDVQDFLGVDKAELFVALQRQNPEPLHELLTNYDELRQSMIDGPYAHLFDE